MDPALPPLFTLAKFEPGNEHRFQPGHPGGPGRPSKLAAWREEVEKEFDKWIRGYLEARDSDDPELAMKAAREVFDRVYGRPKQSIEQSGSVEHKLSLTELARQRKQVEDA